MVIVRCDEDQLKKRFAEFDVQIKPWTRDLVKALSISYGYASVNDYPNLSIRELAAEADKWIYENKSAYYKQNRIKRRKI